MSPHSRVKRAKNSSLSRRKSGRCPSNQCPGTVGGELCDTESSLNDAIFRCRVNPVAQLDGSTGIEIAQVKAGGIRRLSIDSRHIPVTSTRCLFARDEVRRILVG